MASDARGPAERWSRRDVVAGALGFGALSVFAGGLARLPAPSSRASGEAGDESLLALLPFVGEGAPWRRLVDTGARRPRWGSGLDGRQLFDLASLDRDRLVVAAGEFFVRTFPPADLGDTRRWTVAIDGAVARPARIGIDELRRLAVPRGPHLVECSGNSALYRYALIGSAAWEGVPLLEIARRSRPLPGAVAVEVVGRDRHPESSLGSHAGASWVFPLADLEETGAFLATGMNGRALPADHGAPVRLVVPGWYGCACIKWVRRIRWVSADEPATSQMKEFAGRTHQDGVPELARDYAPPAIDAAAMPVRAELWRTPDGPELRLVGVAWGGREPVRSLSLNLRRDGGGPWTPVERLEPADGTGGWRLWTHRLRSPAPGPLALRLRVDDPGVRTRRLDAGRYSRTVEVVL